MSTVTDIITDALVMAGVFDPEEPIPGTEVGKCLGILNLLMDKWNAERMTVFVRQEDTLVLTVGKGSYIIGTSGVTDIASVRPSKVEDAYLRDSSSGQNIDYSIDVNMTQIEYNEIALKSTQVIPENLFYFQSYPNGIIYFDSLPDKAYTLHLFSSKPFSDFLTITDDFTLIFPPGYRSAVTCNLSLELAEYYKRPISQKMEQQAIRTLDNIKAMNSEPSKLSFRSVPGNKGKFGYDVNRGPFGDQ
jgi:hypothetical protein